MAIHLDVQVVSKNKTVPDEAKFKYWAQFIPSDLETNVCVRIVDEIEAKELNKKYRQADKATNVLSFPAEIPPQHQFEINFLGDIVICAQMVEREAQQQEKQLESHWVHLLIHGILHLQGYDHERDSDAEKMESKEIEILQQLGIPNPYI